jgi:hypothetical protein
MSRGLYTAIQLRVMKGTVQVLRATLCVCQPKDWDTVTRYPTTKLTLHALAEVLILIQRPKSLSTETILAFYGSTTSFPTNRQQEVTTSSHVNCSDCRPPCPVHTSHRKTTDSQIKQCFPGTWAPSRHSNFSDTRYLATIVSACCCSTWMGCFTYTQRYSQVRRLPGFLIRRFVCVCVWGGGA